MICREVPRVTERSAFLQGGHTTPRAERKLRLLAAASSLRGVKRPRTVPAGFVCQREVTVGQGIFPVQDGVS